MPKQVKASETKKASTISKKTISKEESKVLKPVENRAKKQAPKV